MSSYRCPLCGANHKGEVDHCRLCGQSLKPGAVAIKTQPVAVQTRAARGNKGILLIGLGLVALLLVGAIVLAGLGRDNKQIRAAKDLVSQTPDGWSTQVEEQGQFHVDLPGSHTRATVPFAGTDDGQVTAWQASVGNETELLAGWGTVSPTLTNGSISGPLAVRYLRDTVIPRYAAANGLDPTDARITEGSLGGLPAVTFQPTRDLLKVKGKDAFAHVTLGLSGTKLYVLQVLTVYKDAPQLPRMATSFGLGAAPAS
jgi:hypothetical protein